MTNDEVTAAKSSHIMNSEHLKYSLPSTTKINMCSMIKHDKMVISRIEMTTRPACSKLVHVQLITTPTLVQRIITGYSTASM